MRLSIQTALTACLLCVIFVTVAHGIPAAPPSDDACGSVTWEGECLGDQLQWCEEGEVLVADCSEVGGTCGYSEENGVFDCVALEGGCGGETYEGRCDGNNVIWCEDATVYEADCGSIDEMPGALCSYSCELGGYDCADPGDYVESEEMCGEQGGDGLQVDFGDSDASGGTTETDPGTGGTSGGCAGGGSGSGALWLLFGLLGLVPARTRRLLS